MSQPSPAEIVRCLKSDMNGDLAAAAHYARRIATGSALNPYADPAMAPAYAEAADRLDAERSAAQTAAGFLDWQSTL